MIKELCFNLWYYLDHQQNITSIAAKAYLLEGNDDEKAAALLAFSKEDYHTLAPYRIKPVHYSVLQRMGVEGSLRLNSSAFRVNYPEERHYRKISSSTQPRSSTSAKDSRLPRSGTGSSEIEIDPQSNRVAGGFPPPSPQGRTQRQGKG
jgi:hypothetical protein